MRIRFLGKVSKIAMCSFLAMNCLHTGFTDIQAEDITYQNEYVQKFSDKFKLDNTNGDNMQILNSLGSYEGDVTFEADVTLTDPSEQQSAALMFGIKSNDINDDTAIRANFHNKVDWTQPVRMWGTALEQEVKCPGDKGSANTWLFDNGINVQEPVHMKVEVKGNKVIYSLNNPGKEEVKVGEGTLKEGYQGGRLGIMTYSSTAEFSNIKVNGIAYGSVVNDAEGFTIRGLDGDAHTVNEAAGSMKGFSYESIVNMEQGQSAALTFGIRDKDNPANSWIGANFDGDKARVFGVDNGGVIDYAEPATVSLDYTKPVQMKLDVDAEGDFAYYLHNIDHEGVDPVLQGTITDYTGGYIGALTFNSSAKFDKVTLQKQGSGLTAFTSVGGNATIDTMEKSVTLSGKGGDHFAMYDNLTRKARDFSLEADVQLINGRSAALVFGVENKKTPGVKWYGANFDTGRGNPNEIMRVFGAGRDIAGSAVPEDMDFQKPIHMKIDVNKEGEFTYSFGNIDGKQGSVTGVIPEWKGGYIGILTFESEAKFSNIQFDDRTDYTTIDKTIDPDERFHTNLKDLSYENGTWRIDDTGLYSDATGKGDSFLYTTSTGKNFVYSTDVKFHEQKGAAALVFRSNGNRDSKNSYAVNIDGESGAYKFWRWQDDSDYQLLDSKRTEVKDSYHLQVVAYKGWISYYLDGKLVANTGDYTIQNVDLGQSTALLDGGFGLLNFNGKISFQNTYFQEFDDEFDPLLSDLQVTSDKGTIEAAGQFVNTESIYMQYVSNETDHVDLNATPVSNSTNVKAVSANGTVYEDLKNIPLETGTNVISVITSAKKGDYTASLTYRVIIVRRKPASSYYNEEYRGQYHYSVKEGWANDPNGLVYYNGKYHLFYQFYNDLTWGPMHWAHATSSDLIHWNEEPIAFFPDENGSMFSGCIVADENNTSGLFKDNKGGLVALITANGNGQRIKIAYSEDEGKTWTKTNKIAADWTDDSLKNPDFRDPKVFRWENKWFMVVAGGPLRIYSSENLLEWKEESAYGGLHTECPDLYPIQANDGKLKWVLSRGGRYYKVGDFKQVEGKWTFVPDEAYQGDGTDKDGIMNFGKDSYAAMTYYVQDFGTASHPTLPDDLVELNWMNNWDYCRDVAYQTGNDTFNGTFNLNLKLGLVESNGKYMLTQTPIKGYESLHTGDVQTYANKKINGNSDLLKDFKGDVYEVKATLKPEAGTKSTGFKVRTGSGEETIINYDIEKERLSIDRSKSGSIINDKFAEVNYQDGVKLNADGTLDLHIYVDKSSVEVFANGYTVAGAVQIFPTPTSVGAQVYSTGGNVDADITIYHLNSIWKDKVTIDTPQKVGVNQKNVNTYIGDTFTLNAWVMPTSASQDVEWSVDDDSLLDITENGNQATFTANKEGTATITITSKTDKNIKTTSQVVIRKNALKTNLEGFAKSLNGWLIDNTKYVGTIGGDNAFTMAETTAPEGVYTYSADVLVNKGIFNMILESHKNAFDGSYAVQINGNRLRLFDFKGDHTLQEVEIKEIPNDKQYHIDITKDGFTIIVSVNGQELIRHEVEEADRQYSGGLFGFGIYDASVEVENIYVRKGYPADHVATQVKEIALSDKQNKEDALKLLPETVEVADKNGTIQVEEVEWNLDDVKFATPQAYTAKGKTTMSSLSVTADIVITTDKTALDKAVKELETLDKNRYTPDSWNMVETAVKAAKNVQSEKFATAHKVSEAIKNLKDAQAQLLVKAHKLTDKENRVELQANLPENIILKVDDITDKGMELLNKEMQSQYDLYKTFDISLWKDGKVYKTNEEIILRLKLDDALHGKSVSIAYINDKGELELFKTIVKDGYAEAEINHLSAYGIVSKKEVTNNGDDASKDDNIDTPKDPDKDSVKDPADKDETPSGSDNTQDPTKDEDKEKDEIKDSDSIDTGDSTNLMMLAGALLVSGGALTVIYRKRKSAVKK